MNIKKGHGGASIRALARKRLKQQQEAASGWARLGVEQSSEAPVNAEEMSPDAEAIARSALADLSSQESNQAALNFSADRVVIATPLDDVDGGEEMRLLCRTLGLEVLDIFRFSTRHIDAGNYLGTGNAEVLQRCRLRASCGAVVVDAPLTPAQSRNLEKQLKCPVLDRHGVILMIFSQHARSKQAQMQVEIAQLKYLQPRLSHLWMGLSRTRGAKGGKGGRGLGETRLELDRRAVKRRIALLTRKLREAEKSFDVQSARRSELPRVALVGYTNAGKSTLMRRLTKAPVEAEDKLFSTLDTTVRPLVPPTEPPILLSDTVGFIRKLPHDLVASFRSTLREALQSRLILHVVDACHPQWQEQVESTEAVLAEIGSEAPRVLLLNKMDQMPLIARLNLHKSIKRFPQYKAHLLLSAESGEGVAEVVAHMKDFCGAQAPAWSQCP